MENFSQSNNLALSSPMIIATMTIIGGAVGYFVRYWLDKNKELNSENIKVKREAYKKFVGIIIDLFQNSKTGEAKQDIDPDFKNKLYDFFKDFSLYASPRTINAFGDMMQYIFKNETNMDTKTILKKLSKLMKEMRKELGLSNISLGWNSEKIFRGIFKDFDKLQ